MHKTFNFPEPEKIGERHDVLIKDEIWLRCVEISKERKVEVSKAINILLEGAIQIYDKEKLEMSTPVIHPITPVKSQATAIRTEIGFVGDKKRSNKWSSKYDACVSCNQTDRKHLGKGYCSRCYFKREVDDSADSNRLHETISGLSRCANPYCEYHKKAGPIIDMIQGDAGYYCNLECKNMHQYGTNADTELPEKEFNKL